MTRKIFIHPLVFCSYYMPNNVPGIRDVMVSKLGIVLVSRPVRKLKFREIIVCNLPEVT